MITTKLKIRIYGDPCLRKKSVPVKAVGPGERMLIKAMIETMRDHKGIGLAAPQVGINEQIFVADAGDDQGPIAVINPKIIKKSGSGSLEEGCLSIPGVVLNIKRPSKVTVRYMDESGKEVEKEFIDLWARVIQHETDHLHGKLITDYAGILAKKKLKKQLKELEEQSKANFK